MCLTVACCTTAVCQLRRGCGLNLSRNLSGLSNAAREAAQLCVHVCASVLAWRAREQETDTTTHFCTGCMSPDHHPSMCLHVCAVHLHLSSYSLVCCLSYEAHHTDSAAPTPCTSQPSFSVLQGAMGGWTKDKQAMHLVFGALLLAVCLLGGKTMQCLYLLLSSCSHLRCGTVIGNAAAFPNQKALCCHR